jgi:hypothetical protein
MRHRSIALPIAVLAAFSLASIVVAGGWAQVAARNVPVDPPAGQETTIEISVLQHGVTPVSWPGLTVVATDAASGTVIRTEARATGPEGSYLATLVFPTEGAWNLTFESTDLVMEGSAAVRVAPPVAAAPTTGVVPAFDVMPLALALIAALAILAIGGVALRNRGAAAANRVSVRT